MRESRSIFKSASGKPSSHAPSQALRVNEAESFSIALKNTAIPSCERLSRSSLSASEYMMQTALIAIVIALSAAPPTPPISFGENSMPLSTIKSSTSPGSLFMT